VRRVVAYTVGMCACDRSSPGNCYRSCMVDSTRLDCSQSEPIDRSRMTTTTATAAAAVSSVEDLRIGGSLGQQI